MTGRETDPRGFIPGANLEALVADQGAADRARAKIEADAELKKAVEGFSAEGSLPPYLPETGARVAVEIIAPAPQDAPPLPAAASAPSAASDEVPSSTAAAPEPPPSSVVIAPEVLAAPVAVAPPVEVAQEPSAGSEQADVLVALAPAPAHNTTRRLQKPPGATAFLKAGAPDPKPVDQDGDAAQKNKSGKLVLLALLTFAILAAGLFTFTRLNGASVDGPVASNGAPDGLRIPSGAAHSPTADATGTVATSVATTSAVAVSATPAPSTTVSAPSSAAVITTADPPHPPTASPSGRPPSVVHSGTPNSAPSATAAPSASTSFTPKWTTP